MFKIIAIIAAGTIPEPPNTNWKFVGNADKIAVLAPRPNPRPSATEPIVMFLASHVSFVLN